MNINKIELLIDSLMSDTFLNSFYFDKNFTMNFYRSEKRFNGFKNKKFSGDINLPYYWGESLPDKIILNARDWKFSDNYLKVRKNKLVISDELKLNSKEIKSYELGYMQLNFLEIKQVQILNNFTVFKIENEAEILVNNLSKWSIKEIVKESEILKWSIECNNGKFKIKTPKLEGYQY